MWGRALLPSAAHRPVATRAATASLAVFLAMSTAGPLQGQGAQYTFPNLWRGFDLSPAVGYPLRNGPEEYLQTRVQDWIARGRSLGLPIQCDEQSPRLAVCNYVWVDRQVGPQDPFSGTPLAVAVRFEDSVAVQVTVAFAERVMWSENTLSLDDGIRVHLTGLFGVPRDSVALTNHFSIWRTPHSLITRKTAPGTNTAGYVQWTWLLVPSRPRRAR
jgi:hypothetical protein